MKPQTSALYCLAYLTGLLAVVGCFPAQVTAWWPLAIAFLGLGVVAGLSLPRMWRFGPRRHQWIVAGLIAGLGIVYLQIRLPQPVPQDISQLLAQADAPGAIVTVTGKILEPPRLTRQRKVQFWLQATAVSQGEAPEQAVTGKVYGTVPLLQGTGLFPGQPVAVTGRLYQPRAALNPGAFDFRTYLAAKGTFAGLAGKQAIALAEPPRWGLWRLRQRIVRAQVKALGSPAGPLLSSIVLGRQAVDLPHDIRDLFIKAGLAHVLAASGFHVSLLLGAILTLTKRLGSRTQLILGVIALVFYVGLTGIQPSVLRAALMGGAALLAIAWEQRIRPVGLLLLVAVCLLLVNPLWIFDLGFALSFLATLGLLVTLPPLLKVFEGLPPVFATAIAVPLAASLWTLPLLIFLYNTVVTYSLIANAVSAIPITAISLGGMASAFAALLWPPAGSAIAVLLAYPLQWLIWGLEFLVALPGSTFAVGRIPLAVLLLCYGLLVLVWLSERWRRRWQLLGLIAIVAIILPVTYRHFTLIQVSVLASPPEQIVVIQERGQVALINSGEPSTVRYTLLPFLQRQGINRIQTAISLADNSLPGWQALLATVPIDRLYGSSTLGQQQLAQEQLGQELLTLKANNLLTVNSSKIELIDGQSGLLRIEIAGQTWWLLSCDSVNEFPRLQPAPQFLIWPGQPLEDVARQGLAAAIATGMIPETEGKVLATAREGAMQWTPERGLTLTAELQE